MSTTAADLVTLLHQRGPVLTHLVAAPTDPATLTTEVSVSRATVDRALASFEEWGLIDAEADADQLEPTLFARLVLMVYDDFEADVDTMIMDGQEQQTGDAPLWSTASERADALALVADRHDLLEFAQTPRDKRTLVAELPYAHSTVDWAVRELEGVGLIQRTAGGYATTSIGQRIANRYRTLLATLGDLLSARDLLAYLPADCPLPPALFVKATIERADENAPYRLFAGVRDRLDTADQVRLLLPTLPTPQLLDVCHHRVVRHGTTLELLTNPVLADTLTTDFPGPFTEMAAAASGEITAHVTDTPSFGVLLTGSAASPTVSILVYDQQAMYGAIHPETDAARTWAENYYERIRDTATEITADLQEDAATAATTPVALAGVPDPARVEREAEGFVQLMPDYFAERTPAPPATAWRAGFDLVDVHAGYTIDREIHRDSDGTGQRLTDALITRLDAGVDHALLGPPGSGKSTVCQAVACRWYKQGRGAVFYRESGTGATFDSPAILRAQLRASEGQALVVVEDAVRAEANMIFRVMENFRDDATVTFLLDARTHEWADPSAFPPDARLDAHRTDTVEMVTMPGLTERDCERLIDHFQETTGHTIDVPTTHLLQSDETEPDDTAEPEQVQASQPAELLLALHRLTLYAEPLADEDTRTPTTLTEDVQQTYAALRSESELALDVGVLVNLLNVAGLSVQPALVYALAEDDDEVEIVRAALSTLDGHLIFTREDTLGTAAYRTVHEAWSELFLDHLLEAAETDRAASERFGRCVSALFALADDETRRERSTAAVGGTALAIERITAAPTKWADTTINRLFDLGLDRPGLARLFGTSEVSPIELPAACSSTMDPRCAVRRGRMYYEGGNYEQAERDFTYTIQLVETADASETAQLQRVKAHSQKNLGAVAYRRGNLDTAVGFYTRARASYRDLSDRRGEADCYNNLGVIACARGNLDRAVAYYERSLIIAQEIDAPDSKQASYLNNLGHVALLRGDFDRAENHLNRSLSLSHDTNDGVNMVSALHNLGVITQKRGDLNQAENYHNQTITISQDIGRRLGKREGLSGLVAIDIDRGDLDQAAEYIQRSLAIDRAMGANRSRAMDLCYLGIIARKRSDYETAETHLTDALTLSREGSYRSEEAQTLVALGDLARDRDSPERARDRFSAAVAIYRDMGAVRDVIETLELVAETCEELNDHDAALAHCETAIATANEAAFDVPHESISEQRARLVATSGDEKDEQ
jgi:tetratricopeptide (TPR) repeat protein/predicted transcriptional regulator